MREIKRPIICFLNIGALTGFFFVIGALTAPSVAAWFDDIDNYVKSLNTSEARHAWGIEAARRPDGIANRLDITFEDATPLAARTRAMQEIGRKFLRQLFLARRIPVAVIVERAQDGSIANLVTVNVAGAPAVGEPAPSPLPGGSC